MSQATLPDPPPVLAMVKFTPGVTAETYGGVVLPHESWAVNNMKPLDVPGVAVVATTTDPDVNVATPAKAFAPDWTASCTPVFNTTLPANDCILPQNKFELTCKLLLIVVVAVVADIIPS